MADVKLAPDEVDILIAVDKTLGSGLTLLTTIADIAAGDRVTVSSICGYMCISQFENPPGMLTFEEFPCTISCSHKDFRFLSVAV